MIKIPGKYQGLIYGVTGRDAGLDEREVVEYRIFQSLSFFVVLQAARQ